MFGFFIRKRQMQTEQNIREGMGGQSGQNEDVQHKRNSRNENGINPHIIKEEDLENGFYARTSSEGEAEITGSGGVENGYAEDVYNSEIKPKNKFSGKEFFGIFKIPIIIIAVLAAAVLFFKFLFSNKPKPVQNVKLRYKNKAIPLKKIFSPSVFDYTANRRRKSAGRSGKDFKFNTKFKKEAKMLNRNIKFNGKAANVSGGGYGRTGVSSAAQPQITKKTVVFIKASYGRYILSMESGRSAAAGSVYKNKYREGIKTSSHSSVSSSSGAVAVPEGTVINAYTKYKIFSYNTSVPVIAVASSNYFAGGKEIIKRGDKFFGTVGVKHSLNRLNMNFGKIIKKSGKTLTIDAMAMMPDGSGGIKGDVHSHYAGNILTSIAQGVAGAASLFVGGGSGVNSSNPYTFQNQVRENVAQNELNSAQDGLNNYAESNQNDSVTLPADSPIKIIFLKPLYIKEGGRHPKIEG